MTEVEYAGPYSRMPERGGPGASARIIEGARGARGEQPGCGDVHGDHR